MFSDGAVMTWALICAEAVFLSGCDRGPMVQAPQGSDAQSVATTPLSQVDLGASLLAEVDNARMAIELRDRVAAYNDVGQALAFARQLTNRPSKLLLSEPPTGEPRSPLSVRRTAVSPSRMTVFGAMVKLGSAQAELDSNLEAADADLHAIQTGIPPQLIPSNLQLLRAAASLDVARNAVSEGRNPEVRTQLLAAQLALNTYTGPGHVADAKELAAVIGQTLGRESVLGTISPYRISMWLGRVAAWTGSEPWVAAAAGP